MRLFLTLVSAVMMFSGSAFAQYNASKLYKVTVVNLTKGQPLTPALVAVHAPHHSLVHLGQAASEGLAALAQDGVTATLEAELEADSHVVRSKVGNGIILPGQKDEIVVEANNPRFKFTVLTMLASPDFS